MIRLSQCSVGEQEELAVSRVLRSHFLGMGKEVQKFEEGLTGFFGRPAVCVVNGTAALHLALQALGVGPGDEVLVQSLTYLATFQAISATGAIPVSCEVNPNTLTLDWKDAENRVNNKTKVLMLMHYSGGVGDLEELYAFAKRHQLRVVEDAAHAFGTIYNGARVGSFGDVVCFSFDGIKNITSGEGGCIVTDDEDILQKVRDARLLGVEKDTEKRFIGARSWQFNVQNQGWRYHMSDLMAAIGSVQLERFAIMSKKRQELAKLYDKLLDSCSYINRISHDYTAVVPHIYSVRILGIKYRDRLRERLQEKNIQTGVHYQPNHYLDLYKTSDASNLPVTDNIYPELLTLPLHVNLNDEDVDYVVETLLQELNYEY